MWLQGEEIMIEIRKTITFRETVFSELGVDATPPTTRAVGMRSFGIRSSGDSSRI
jgi:hypothetical protein